MLLKFKIINILFIFSALIFVKFSFAGNKSPIISVYNLEKNNLNKEYYKIIKNTVFKELNDNTFFLLQKKTIINPKIITIKALKK